MPILNLENPAFISVDLAGRINANGTVGVYVADGLFTTLATVYSDQVKTSELTNPVTLNQDGTKEIWYDVKVDIREVTFEGALIRDTLNLDPNASQASVQGFNLAQNGSFEVDSTSDGQPDNWTITPYTGSAIAITNDIVTDGVAALEFNTSGAGSGGGIATSAKFPVTEGTICSVFFSFYATNATTLNTFSIYWYDHLDVLLSISTVTMPASGSVPTSWTSYSEDITAHASATQGEVVLAGIASGGSNKESKAYFDGIKVINSDLATLNTTQTLTNKTLTSPTINTPVIESDSGDLTVETFQVYGMVTLTDPELILNLSAEVVGYQTLDMSAAYNQAVLDGAKVAKLYCRIEAADSTPPAAVFANIRPVGSSNTISILSADTNVANLDVIDSTFYEVTLDASGDFEYDFDNSGISPDVKTNFVIYLVGYYV